MNDFEILEAYSTSMYGQTELWVKNNLDSSYYKSFLTSISYNQLQSKKWLIEELNAVYPLIKIKNKLHIEIVGGWFGFPLLELLNNLYKDNIKQIDYYDIDTNCHKVLWQYIDHIKPTYKISVFNDYFQRQEARRRDIIINTSQEHMPYITNNRYIKNSPIYILQSNDQFELEEHTNCVEFEEELVINSGLTEIMYNGSLELDHYTRFMVIGRS